ncbi:hypothetical protein N658DRAFT_422492 [Parathielavia hyrcaniae]|uniref:Uncharacterized protein n=1 Tax=Parathielavia hyrcaniae TaxID=113614 RepID=A0AAN6Q3K1_9PEZI|nr:hypothetical protein N658DRAFT_422492 [Parathielavia hyrcaniae]
MFSHIAPVRPPDCSFTRPGSSLSYQTDPGELMVDCNFPELLVRDLEVSEGIFMVNDMTAGSPCAGPGTFTSDGSDSFPAPIMRFRPSYQQDQQQEEEERTGARRPYPDSLLEEREHQHAEPTYEVNNFAPGDERRDSCSVTSVGMGPYSIRTRQQSVATAATSVSGRCSSLCSRNTKPQSPPGLSPCSSNSQGSSPPGTWYADERELRPDVSCCSEYTAKTSITDPHQHRLDLVDDTIMSGSQKAPRDREPSPAPADAHSSKGCYPIFSRPHTPASQPQQENRKPRIIDIPPVIVGSRSSSSLQKGHYAIESASLASEFRESTSAARARAERQRRTSCSINRQGEPSSSIQLLATANGRTVIDASALPPVPPTRRDQQEVMQHRPPQSPLTAAVDESHSLSDEEAPGSSLHAEGHTGARQSSLADLRRSVDTSAETLAYTPNLPPPGMPLPPDVMESLRVSISCFPETMLLTSSLSIETIRAYSRKVKHRAALDRQLQSSDTDSLYSNPHNTRLSKRWNMSWLSQSRRSSKLHHHPSPWSTQPPSFDPFASTLSMGLPRTAIATTTTPRATHLWTPIQAIFPTAPPRLCDALYAHLLAYNYLRSLCPAPPPTTTTPTNQTAAAVHGSSPPAARDDDDDDIDDTTRSLGIPHKAASLLGMDDPVSAAAAYRTRKQTQVMGGGGSSRARMLLGRAAGGGGGGARRQSSYGVLRDELIYGSSSSSVSRRRTRIGGGGGGSGSGGNQEIGGASPAMRELLAGLGRCVNLLVATMRKGGGGDLVFVDGGEMGAGGKEVGSLVGEGKRTADALLERAEPVLVRALCEVVRCAEERL